MNIISAYNKCLSKMGESNEDVIWYRTKRPKSITRKSFFDAVVFAIWVAGMKRKSVDSFLDRARTHGFIDDFAWVSNVQHRAWKKLLRNIHGADIPSRAAQKWDAIRTIAKKINGYESDQEFRKAFFNKKQEVIV